MVELADRVLLPMRTIDGLWRPDRDPQPGLHIVRNAFVVIVVIEVIGAQMTVLAWEIRVKLAIFSVGAPRFGGGVRLTRTTNESIRRRNRETACPDSLPRPNGLSCDEFPFASTFEGAASQPFG